MKFLRDMLSGESSVSSRRLIAFWVAFVVLSYIVYIGVNEENAIDFLIPVLSFIGILLGVTTVQNIVSLVQKHRTKRFVGGENPKDDDEEVRA